MSAYGPLVDGNDPVAVSEIWTADGLYDWGGGEPEPGTAELQQGPLGYARGRNALQELIRGEFHQQLLAGGAAHVMDFPHIWLLGDRAVGTAYSRMYVRDGDSHR
jgi:SnoaL-like domain